MNQSVSDLSREELGTANRYCLRVAHLALVDQVAFVAMNGFSRRICRG